jgi:hypothetical protein
MTCHQTDGRDQTLSQKNPKGATPQIRLCGKLRVGKKPQLR